MPFLFAERTEDMEEVKTKNTDKNNQIRVQKVVNGVKYNVGVYFSQTSKETMLDKIKKIVVKENVKNI